MYFKITFALFFSFLLKFSLQGQNSGVISYRVSSVTKQIFLYKLYFDNEKSIFVANRGKKKVVVKVIDADFKLDTITATDKQLYEAIYGSKPVAKYFFDEEGDVIYKNFSMNTLIFREINERNPVLVEEPKMPCQIWTLIDSAKKIGKFICQKATCSFRGRIYDVWYTTEIPISDGPWKLHGLPGLILEAQTRDNIFSCKFEGIEVPLSDISIIKAPLKGDKIELKNYQIELEKRKNENIRRINANNAEISRTYSATISVTRTSMPYQELNYDDIKK